MSIGTQQTGLRAIDARGISALVRDGDCQRTVVCLHGIGSNAASFAPLMAVWPQGPMLLAWTAPGYGASIALQKEWPVADDYALALASSLDAQELPNVDLVAHSLGCLIGCAFARRFPGRVRRLALLSPALGYSVPPGTVLPPAIAARITDLDELGAAKFAAARAARLVFQPERKPDVFAAVRDAMAQVTLPGYAQAVRMLASGDLIADASTLSQPITIANGIEDVITPKAGAERLHAACAGSQLTLVPDAGHALPQEAPETIVRVLAGSFGGAA